MLQLTPSLWDRHGVLSTLHIVFFNFWYLSFDYCEIEAIPFLPSTSLSTPFPVPTTWPNDCCCELD